MKKLSILLLITLMTTFTTFSNNNRSIRDEVSNKLRTKIITLLGNYQNVLDTQTEKAAVKFMINRKGEIIVLSVDTKQENISNFIKSKLNYKAANIKNVKYFATYTLPIKFIKN